jgi:CHAT domain-containing protein
MSPKPILAGRRLALFVAALLCGQSSVAAAADDLLSLCSMEAGAQVADADPTLLNEAGNVERQIGESRDPVMAADQVIARLGTQTRGAVANDPRALARYCAAAGEAFRLGKMGNAFQARALLLGAFRNSEGSGDGGTSALVAYRLGLVTVGSGGQSGQRSAVITPAAIPAAPAGPAEEGPCGELANPSITTRSNAIITVTALRCSIRRARASENFDIGAKADLRLARFWLDQARRDPGSASRALAEARRVATDALAPAARIADEQARSLLLGRLAEVILDSGGPAGARLDALPAMVERSGSGNVVASALAEGLRGRIALSSGNRDKASAHLRQAIYLESQSDAPLRLADWHLLLAAADPERADVHTLEAFRALGATRPLMPRFDPLTEESNFSIRIRPVFEAVVDVLLRNPPSQDDGRYIANVQEIVEQYRQAELQNVFGNDCVPARIPVDPKQLKADEAILYPVLLGDRVELIYASGKGDKTYRRLTPNRDVGRAEVVRLVAQLTDATSTPDSQGWRDPAKRLYDILIAPIEAELPSGGTLVIVPDGPLAGLPFAALIDRNGQPLVQRTKLSVVPSLAYAQPGGRAAQKDIRVVAAALEKEVALGGGVFPKLEGTADEAKAVVQGSRGSRVIENFKRADLIAALSQQRVDVLHLATHASFNGRSDRSFIVADGEAIPISELRTLVAQNLARGEDLDLLVLSACETAVGDDEASMGLAGAAVQSGASSAIASLWEVSDLGTSELMKGFYARYRAGETKADALRNAQLALIERGGEFADPNVWAAFTLLGSWR